MEEADKLACIYCGSKIKKCGPTNLKNHLSVCPSLKQLHSNSTPEAAAELGLYPLIPVKKREFPSINESELDKYPALKKFRELNLPLSPTRLTHTFTPPITHNLQQNSSSSNNTNSSNINQYTTPTNPFVSPLLTDMYQISMSYAHWKSGKQVSTRCTVLTAHSLIPVLYL